MLSLVLALILGAIYIFLRRKDRRMLRNGLFLVGALWFALMGVTQILAYWFPWTEWITAIILLLTPFAVVVLAGFLIANGVTMLRREGRSLGNLLSLAAGLAIFALPVIALALTITLNPIAIGLAALLFFLCSYLGVVFVVILAYSAAYGRMAPEPGSTAIIVLGSQIIRGAVPPLLRSRLDKALELYRQEPVHPPLLIPSGGQGHDESRPEGEAMAEYLIAAGAPIGDVFPEERARNTVENLRFSAAIAQEHGRAAPFTIVTNNYHVLRAALLARKLKINAQVVGSPTARYYYPSAFLREFVAILREHWLLHAILCLPFIAITILFTVVVASLSASS